jgi:hypothetical protein
MKRSFVAVVFAASVFAFGACAGDDAETEIEPVEEVQPPAPAPAPMPMDTTMVDTMMMTTTTM